MDVLQRAWAPWPNRKLMGKDIRKLGGHLDPSLSLVTLSTQQSDPWCGLHHEGNTMGTTTSHMFPGGHNPRGKNQCPQHFCPGSTGAGASQCVTPRGVRQFGGL